MSFDNVNQSVISNKATDAAAVAAPDAPADLDADALAFVQEMRRRR